MQFSRNSRVTRINSHATLSRNSLTNCHATLMQFSRNFLTQLSRNSPTQLARYSHATNQQRMIRHSTFSRNSLSLASRTQHARNSHATLTELSHGTLPRNTHATLTQLSCIIKFYYNALAYLCNSCKCVRP